jgi:sugar lactone lactonase YvrE
MTQNFGVQVVAEGFSFLEGARWRAGYLYASDFFTGRVLAFDTWGKWEVLCTLSGQPSGLGFAPDGALLIVSMLDRRLLRLARGELSQVADLSSVVPFPCNDMLVDESGTAYVGNFGWDAEPDAAVASTQLVAVAPDGGIRVAAEDLIFPNGIVKGADGTMLVAESYGGRITAFDTDSSGQLKNRRVWADFAQGPYRNVREALASQAPLPDGMALDEEGAVWMGDAGGRAALRIAAGGRVLDRVETPGLTVFGVALGGPDRRTLYLCAAPPLLMVDYTIERKAVLLSARVPVPGAGLP